LCNFNRELHFAALFARQAKKSLNPIYFSAENFTVFLLKIRKKCKKRTKVKKNSRAELKWRRGSLSARGNQAYQEESL